MDLSFSNQIVRNGDVNISVNIIGHDRGARITHRLCLDHPARVTRAVLLDIIPTRTLYETVNQEVASVYFHWFFLIHATCEEYRVGASIDLEHDRADNDNRVQCPLLVVWGSLGPMGKLYDILPTWQNKADNVQGLALECGHYPAQEKPEELLAALEEFL